MKIANFRFAPYILLTLAAGIITASFNNYAITIAVAVILIGIGAVLYRNKHFRIILIGLITAIIGLSSMTLVLHLNQPKLYENVLIEGRVTDSVEYNGDSYTFMLDNLRIDSRRISGKAKASVSTIYLGHHSIENGDIITFRADVLHNGLDLRDSYSVYKYRRGERYSLKVLSIENREQGKVKLDEKIRAQIKIKLNDTLSDSDISGMAYALITGSREYISPDTKDILSRAGITHIFAVSGMHVGILAGAIYFLLKKLKVKGLISIIITCSILCFYAYICGFLPSVSRAVLMSFMVMLGSAIGKRNDLISIVSLSAVILLLISPVNLFDISFLLSYGAVFGIVLLYKPINRLTARVPNIIRPVLITSMCANIALFPLITWYFKSFSLYFLPVNMIILPFIGIVYIILIIGVIISLFISQLTFIISLSGAGLMVIKEISAFFASLPLSSVAFYSLGVFVIFYYLIIVLASDYVLIDKRYSSKLIIVSMVGVIAGFIIALMG